MPPGVLPKDVNMTTKAPLLKNSLKDAVLDGEVENNYESAKKFLDKKFEEVKAI